MSIISIRDLHKTYEVTPPVTVLRGVDLEVQPGERLAVVVNSGAGKSALLNIIGLLDAPTSGSYQLAGKPTETMERDATATNSVPTHSVSSSRTRTCSDNARWLKTSNSSSLLIGSRARGVAASGEYWTTSASNTGPRCPPGCSREARSNGLLSPVAL